MSGHVQPIDEITLTIQENCEYAYKKGAYKLSIVDCAAFAPYIPLKTIHNGNDTIYFHHKNLKVDIVNLKKASLCKKIPFSSRWYCMV